MPGLAQRLKIFSIFWITIVVYFLIPLFVDSITPPSWVYVLDQNIPFIWWMIIPYYFYYIFVVIPPFIIKDKVRLKLLTSVLVKSSILCYLFFIIWPIDCGIVLNSIPKEHPMSFLHSSITFDFLYQNAFPSMHVAGAVLIGASLAEFYPKQKWIIYSIVTGIFFATFLIKQHYILDSIAGLAIGMLGYLYYRKKLIS